MVLLGLDGFPLAALGPDRTPILWRLGGNGGRASFTGIAPLPSTTYPGFATLLTGCLPARHLVRTTGLRPGAVPGWAGRQDPAVQTLLEICAESGRRTTAVVGDHLLQGVLRLGEATIWPPGGIIPAGTPLDAHGYPPNEAARPHLLEAVADETVELVFGHLNETDTWGHDLGPDHPTTLACATAVDAIIGEVVEALRPTWSHAVLIVTSDHDMEAPSPLPPIELRPSEPPLEGLVQSVTVDGGAALLRPVGGASVRAVRAALSNTDGIHLVEESGDVMVAGAVPGRWFAGAPQPAGGFHGGPATARTLAIVAGGHPVVPRLAAALAASPPHLADWGPTICGLLGLPARPMDGADLAA